MKHFWADSEYLGKINTKKKLKFFFQCLGLHKDPQSFGSQNLRRPLEYLIRFKKNNDKVLVFFGFKHICDPTTKLILIGFRANKYTMRKRITTCLNPSKIIPWCQKLHQGVNERQEMS